MPKFTIPICLTVTKLAALEMQSFLSNFMVRKFSVNVRQAPRYIKGASD